MDLARIASVLRRRWLLWSFVVIGLMLLVDLGLRQLPDRYLAQAKLVVDANPRDAENGVFFTHTQAALVQSRPVVERAAAKLKLKKVPGFAGPAPTQKEKLLAQFQRGLKARAEENAAVVTLQYRSVDPVFAASALNALIDAYITEQQEAARAARQLQAEPWATLAKTLPAAQAPPPAPAAPVVIARPLPPSPAARKRAELEAQLGELNALGGQPEVAMQLPFVRQLPAAQAWWQAYEALQQKRQALAERFRPQHPLMLDVAEEEKQLRSRQQAVLEVVAQALQSERQIVLKELAAQRAEARRLTSPPPPPPPTATAVSPLLSVLPVLVQLQSQQKEFPEIRVVTRAVPPTAPYEPKRLPVWLASLILAMIAASGLCLLREYAVKGYQTPSRLEAETGLPCLAQIPESRESARAVNHLQLLDPARAPFYAEAIRGLRATLFAEGGPKVLLVCSSMPEEGKSATALSLASVLRQSGQRVILVDADLRRSQLAKSLKLDTAPGLAEVLAGHLRLEQVLVEDATTGLKIMPAGRAKGHPLDLLQRAALQKIFTELKAQADVVIVDAPPVLQVCDAAVLSPFCDACLYLVRWERTPRRMVQQGLRLLRSFYAPERFVLALSRVERHLQRYYQPKAGDYHYFTNYHFAAATPPQAAPLPLHPNA